MPYCVPQYTLGQHVKRRGPGRSTFNGTIESIVEGRRGVTYSIHYNAVDTMHGDESEVEEDVNEDQLKADDTKVGNVKRRRALYIMMAACVRVRSWRVHS